jgi:hypothetical protein
VKPEHIALLRDMESIAKGGEPQEPVLKDRTKTLGMVYPKRPCPDCEGCPDAAVCCMPVAEEIVKTMRERKKGFRSAIIK